MLGALRPEPSTARRSAVFAAWIQRWLVFSSVLLAMLHAEVTHAAPAIRATIEQPKVASESLTQGKQAAARGDFGAAVEALQKADEEFGQAGNKRSQANTLLQLAAAYHALGQRRQAVVALDRAQELATQLGQADLQLAVLNARGAILLGWSDAAAVETLRKAVELAQREKNPRAEASILNNLGNALAAAQHFPEARESFRRCVELARATGQTELGAQAGLNAAAAAKEVRDFPAAVDLLQQSRALIAKSSASHSLAKLHLKAGQLWLALGAAQTPAQAAERTAHWERAGEAFHLARALSVALRDQRTTSLAAGNLGHLHELAGRRAEANQFTQEAIFTAQACGAAELLYRWEWQAGRLLLSAGDRSAALGAYRRAAKTLESGTIRNDLALAAASRPGAVGFRRELGPLFYELADLLLQTAAQTPERGAAQALLLEARNTVELLKSAELDDYFQDACQSVVRKKIRDVDSVSPQTAIIYPIALADRLELLLSLPGGLLQSVTVPVGAAELEAVVLDLQDKLRTRTTHEFVGPARKLHGWMIGRIEPLLAAHRVETLVFVPDGVLRTVPMGALYDGTNFLARRYALALTPGLTLMDPQASALKAPTLLLNGLSASRHGFDALPNVVEEVRQIRAAFGGTVLTNQFFTAGQVRREFARAQYSMVHLATHGQFDREAAKSFVLTYDERLSLDGLESLIRPSAFRGQPVELLTLSACETAVGDDRAALGLAGVAIKAGARSAIATLWCVDDEASAKLISTFYAELRQHPERSKARALQAAQRTLMDDPNYRHPFYWSPFLLIGNWL